MEQELRHSRLNFSFVHPQGQPVIWLHLQLAWLDKEPRNKWTEAGRLPRWSVHHVPSASFPCRRKPSLLGTSYWINSPSPPGLWGAQQVHHAWSFYALRTCLADRRVNCKRPLTSFRWASDLRLIVLSNESFWCNNSTRKHKTLFSGMQLREKLAINCFQYLTHLQIYDGWNLLFQRSEKWQLILSHFLSFSLKSEV